MVGIYKITSPSGRIYIGQSWSIRYRWYNHGKSNHTPILFSSIKKYGKENHLFEVIHELPIDIEQIILDEYEKLYIDLYVSAGVKLMNIKEGGSCGKPSKETIEKVRLKNIGRKVTWGDKISKAQKGKYVSEETRRKLSISKTGIKLSKEHIEKLRLAATGTKHPHSKQTKSTLSETSKNWWNEVKNMGYNGYNTTLTNNDIISIRTRIMNGERGLTKMAKEYNVSLSRLSHIIHLRSYKHVEVAGYGQITGK